MSVEDRLGERMRACADEYRPDAGPEARIQDLVRRRRRARRRGRVGLGLALSATVAAVVTALVATGAQHSRQVVVVGPSATTPAPTFAGERLLAVTATKVETVDPRTGAVDSVVALSPPLADPPDPQAAFSARTGAIYLSVADGVTCRSEQVIAVDPHTGRWRTIVRAARSPAVSPDGRTLAYLTTTATGAGCLWNAVNVENLATGTAGGSWLLFVPSGPTAWTGFNTVAWEPDGRHLLIGAGTTDLSGIEILDTTAPLGADNPQPVPAPPDVGTAPGVYSDPQPGPSGRILAFRPDCRPETQCVEHPGTGIVTVDPATGEVTSTLVRDSTDPGVGLDALLTDPADDVLAVTGNGQVDSIAGGRLVQVSAGVAGAAWAAEPG